MFQKLILIAVLALLIGPAIVADTISARERDGGLDISGSWELDADADGQPVAIKLKLDQEDDAFSGTVVSHFGGGTVENGKITDFDISATLKVEIQGQPMDLKLTAKVEGDIMDGLIVGDMIPRVTFKGKRSNAD